MYIKIYVVDILKQFTELFLKNNLNFILLTLTQIPIISNIQKHDSVK